MSASGFTPRQRRIILLLVLIVVVVFGLLAGFLITSLDSMETAPVETSPPVQTATPPPSPSPLPATSTPDQQEGFWPQVRAARLFDQIAHQVETQRALSPRAEVPLSFLKEREMEETLQELHAEDDPEPALLSYTVLGLLPSPPEHVQVHAPAGIYVAEQEQLYVAVERPENDADTQAVLAHAYAHALQDQHFDLEGLDARAHTTDERLALRALTEGDATLITGLYRYGSLSSADWEPLTNLIVEAEQPLYGGELAGDRAWEELRHFPNQEGRRFVDALLEQGGWDAVNRSYTSPPRSTEQILHPSRYLGLDSADGQPDQPSAVVVPDLGPVLGGEWQLLLQDTLGEFVIGLYLNQVMPEEAAWRRAEGWDGDTFLVWERKDGRRLTIWRTVWDSSLEALEFERGLKLLIPQLHLPVQPIEPPRGLSGQWWETDSGSIHLRRAGRYLLLVRAPDSNTVMNALERLP